MKTQPKSPSTVPSGSTREMAMAPPSRRRRFLGAIALAAGALAAALPLRADEPSLAGRPVKAWLEDLKSEDGEAVKAAEKALGKLGAADKAAVPVLAAALKDKASRVRISAANALGDIGPDAAAAAGALKALSSDSVPEVRAAAAAALERIQPQ